MIGISSKSRGALKLATKPAASSPKPKPAATDKGWKAGSGSARGATATAVASTKKAVRDSGELWAPWKAVSLAERPGNRHDGRSYLKDQPDAQKIKTQLENFIQKGTSSLTPYEAQTLAKAIGYDDIAGSHLEPRRPVTNGKLTVGDRVQLTENGVKQTGIVAEVETGTRAATAQVLIADDHSPSGLKLKSVKNPKVVTPAFIDGRIE